MSHEYENYTPEIPTVETPESPVTTELPDNISVTPEKGRRSRTRTQRPKTNRQEQKKAPKTNEKPVEPFLSKIKPWCTANNLHLVLGFVLGALGVYLAVSFIGYFSTCLKDQAIVNNTPIGHAPNISNPGGEGGARLSEFLINECFGIGSFVIVIWLIALSLRRLTGWPKFRPLSFTIKCLLGLITVSLIVGLLTLATQTPVNWGGYHGRYFNREVISFIGWAGGVILCVMWIAIFVVVCMRDVIKWIVCKKKERDERKAAEAAQRAEEERRQREIEALRRQEEGDIMDSRRQTYDHSEATDEEEESIDLALPPYEDELDTYSLPEEYEPEPIQSAAGNSKNSEETGGTVAEETGTNTELTEDQDDTPEESEEVSKEDNKPKEEPGKESAEDPEGSDNEVSQSSEPDNDPQMVVNVNTIDLAKNNTHGNGSTVATYPYEFPKLEFLRPGVEKISVDATEQLENKEKIRKTLLDFGIPIVSIEATVGPTVTLYEIRPDTGVKIAKIRNLVDDIALSLAAVGVRIIAPIPGKGTVGIEVANKDPQTVSMRTVIQSRKFQESKAKLPVALGSTISNEVYVADLAKMPHLLVAGATGQGKSVGLNAIISSLLYSKRPEELKFVMIDPKRVEFSLYSMIEAHYLAKIPDAVEPIITDMKKVVATLSSLCVEMENRYDLLKNAQVRNIDEYNEKFKEGRLNSHEGHRFLPYIVVIIDEFSDLIMTAGKEVETPIARLAQMARAVGMHVIIATQRPSTNVITGVIKANFPVRIAFKVSSGVDSKTILDTTGAQQLIGRGDLLISMNSEMVRVQCAFIDTPEVEKVCQYVMEQPYGKGAYILPEPLAGEDSDSGSISDGFGGGTFGDRDPLFSECARYVVMAKTASASSLQRRYSIGYNRAGKIMDQMEALGIVGPTTGGKARDVLIDSITLESILSANS